MKIEVHDNRMAQWFTIWESKSESGTTKVYAVVDKETRELVGRVKWYGGWQRYCYFPNAGFDFGNQVFYDSDFLRWVAEYCDLATKAQLAK